MKSGTSEEELLEEQQQELNRLKKLREAKDEETKKPFFERQYSGRTIVEHTLFYTTATLVFFSVAAGTSILFLVPLYVDPAISTLASDFNENPTMCITTRREDLTGLLNCSWSSCREGCTSDVFKCVHIYVEFIEQVDELANFTFPFNATMQELANLTTEMEDVWRKSVNESVLLVNIKGCGYSPRVRCKNFTDTFGYEGAVFPCFYSKINKTVVLTNYNKADQVTTIVHFFLVPFLICIIASIGICVLHCKCNCKKEQRRPRRSRVENLSDNSISTRVDLLTPAIEVYKPPQL